MLANVARWHRHGAARLELDHDANTVTVESEPRVHRELAAAPRPGACAARASASGAAAASAAAVTTSSQPAALRHPPQRLLRWQRESEVALSESARSESKAA